MTNGELRTVDVSQVEPLSSEYSCLMIADPPEPPGVKATVKAPLLAVTVSIAGAVGIVAVRVEITFDSASLTPTALTAFNLT